MAKAVSFINLKGGVAKTTTTIQIAECLVQKHNKRVLVVDLDPQTNATAALIG
jgi:chromosome partitioning protein